MKIRKNYIFNRQNLLLLVVIVFIILINSSQEHYLSLDERRSTTLETVTGSNSTVHTNEPSSSLYTPPPTVFQPPDNIQIPAKKPSALFIPVTIAVIILLVLLILNIKRNKEIKYYGMKRITTRSQLAETHRRFRTQIRSLVEVLSDYLKKQQYNKGIIFGYHTLDSNMKRLVGMSRDASMTPKEFAQTLKLPEIIPHLEIIINLFYLAQYRKKPMTYDELALFIEQLSKMEQLSISREQIKIVERKEIT